MKASVLVVVLSYLVSFFSGEMSVYALQTPSEKLTIAKINLNQADASVLMHSVKGIGKKRAESIVNYRNQHGEFKSVMDLAQVRGLGQSFVSHHLEQLQAKFIMK